MQAIFGQKSGWVSSRVPGTVIVDRTDSKVCRYDISLPSNNTHLHNESDTDLYDALAKSPRWNFIGMIPPAKTYPSPGAVDGTAEGVMIQSAPIIAK